MSGSELIRREAASGSQHPVPWNPEQGYYVSGTHDREGLGEQIAAFLDLIVRRRVSFISFFLGTIGLIALYTFLATPEYVARSFVLVELEDTAQPVAAFGGYTENIQFLQKSRSLSGEILLLKISNPLARRVGDRLIEMGQVPGTEESLGILYNDDGEPRRRWEIISELSEFVEFEAVAEEANVIRILATSEIAGEAALIANMYADEYVRLTQEANRAHLSSSRRFLEEQEEKWRGELYAAEETVRNHGAFRGSESLDQKGTFLVDQIAQLESRRDEASIDLQMRRASLSSLQRELDQISPQLAERIASDVDRQIESERERVGELEVERSNILLRYPGSDPSELDHPRLNEIDMLLATSRATLSRLSEEYVRQVESSGGIVGAEGLNYVAELKRRVAQEQIAIDGIVAQVQTVERRLQSYLAEMSKLPDQSLQVVRLERTRAHATQMYESVVGRLQEVLIAEQSEPGYARTIREAGVPGIPAEPNVPRNLLLGLLFGILIGGAATVVLDKVDNRLYRPDFVKQSGHAIAGIIPDMTPVIKEHWAGEQTTMYKGKSVSTALVGLLNSGSAVTEAFRHLRTYIQFSGRDRLVRRILVTSSNMSEGKSVTASNLALVMAQAGRSTVLIDADMGRPRIDSLFGLERTPGLSDLLEGEIEFSKSLFASDVELLSIIPAGSSTASSSELLGSKAFRELLSTLSAEYDMVIIDSPPVRAATDAALLSTQTDGTLLVVKAGATKTTELDLAIEQLGSVGANVIGTVFNGFDVRMAYGYNYKYSNYTDYASYSKYSEVE